MLHRARLVVIFDSSISFRSTPFFFAVVNVASSGHKQYGILFEFLRFVASAYVSAWAQVREIELIEPYDLALAFSCRLRSPGCYSLLVVPYSVV